MSSHWTRTTSLPQYLLALIAFALDPRSEYDLFLRFAQLTQGKMALMVTHRLASIQMVDRIMVLKRGKLVEDGSHAELLSQGSEYASLYHMQSELYQSEY